MMDFVELEVVRTPVSIFLNNSLLEFERVVNEKTGELDNCAEASFVGLKIMAFDSGRIIIKGSLHKYKNEGLHNADNFSFWELALTINRICQALKISPYNCIIHHIEFGVNIRPPVSTNEILEGLMFHKARVFSRSDHGLYRQLKHQRYVIKVYDKRRLSRPYFDSKEEICRYELKIRKMEHLRELRVSRLSDLLVSHWVDPIGKMLIDTWNEILFFDPTLKDNESNTLKWSNHNYWKSLSRQTRYVERNKYKKAVQKNSQGLQSLIGQTINDKWQALRINR